MLYVALIHIVPERIGLMQTGAKEASGEDRTGLSLFSPLHSLRRIHPCEPLLIEQKKFGIEFVLVEPNRP
jgi:hypothetical protein